MQRVEPHEGDGRRTIWTSDNSVMAPQGFGIDFGHHERNLGIHAIGRAFINYQTTPTHGLRGQFFSNRGARGKKSKIEISESRGRGFLYGNFLLAKNNVATHGTSGGQGPKLRERQRMRLQQGNQFLTDRSGGADDTDSIRFRAHDE